MTFGGSRWGARTARACALVAAIAALFAACTYPQFGFEPTDDDDDASGAGGGGGVPSGAGQGGQMPVGGATTVSGSSTNSSSSGHAVGGAASGGGEAGSGGTPEPTVPCGDPSTQCAPGEVCCYHDTTPSLDKCGDAGACGASFTEFSCNWHDDCPEGYECCATLDATFGWLLSIACELTCSGGSELLLCSMNNECPDQTCDAFIGDYPGYKWCE